MFRMFHFEVDITRQIIGEETHTQFKSDQTYRIKKIVVIGLGEKVTRLGEVTCQNCLANYRLETNRFPLLSFLSEWVASGTHAVPNVIVDESRLYGIEIYQADGATSTFFDHHIIHFGIAM